MKPVQMLYTAPVVKFIVHILCMKWANNFVTASSWTQYESPGIPCQFVQVKDISSSRVFEDNPNNAYSI